MNDEQAKLWNGASGQAWVEAQEVLDQAFRPIEDILADAVSATGAASVLDVGCGTGATTLASARRLGPKGRSVGVDLSEPMLALARARAGREALSAEFICADAQTFAFSPGSFDLVLSRFGVMFFDDPVRAFANLRRATRDGGQLRLVVFRSPADNPFMTTAERAAAPLLPKLPPRRPGAPGQFALADRDHVEHILDQSGWKEIDLRELDASCAFAEKSLVLYLTLLGPVGRALTEVDEGTRREVVKTVRAAFEPYVHGAEVRFTAGCWLVGARARPGS
jgi:ubiquinone/menaquinone biosynthesis C-methylase UbiE